MPHWKNTPVPAINSVVHFYGICAQISSHSLLTIEIEGITLHISPPPLPTSSIPNEGGLPSKKCCFQTHAAMPHLENPQWWVFYCNCYFHQCKLCIHLICPHWHYCELLGFLLCHRIHHCVLRSLLLTFFTYLFCRPVTPTPICMAPSDDVRNSFLSIVSLFL